MNARHIRIIVHGGRAEDPILDDVVRILRGQKHVVSVRPTWEQDDAAELAIESVELGADVLVAAGGDGTLNEVINGLMNHGATIPLGIVPLGTANDFASAAAIPADDPEMIAELLARGVPAPVDVARVDDRYFVNAATGGFAAEAAGGVSPGLKRVFGGIAYFLAGIAHLGSAQRRRITLEGPELAWSGQCLGFAVTNARSAGGGHRICPDATIDDGRLDVVVLPGSESLLDAARVAPDLKFEPDEEHVLRWTVPWVDVAVQDSVALNIDGEPFQFTRSRFEVKAGAAQLILPRGCPLLRASSDGA